LEVAAQVVGCQRGFILLLKGREWRGWSIFFGELSKVMAFFEAMRDLPSSVDSPLDGMKNEKYPSPRSRVLLEPLRDEEPSKTLDYPLGKSLEYWVGFRSAKGFTECRG
jgi:hypothetical protein